MSIWCSDQRTFLVSFGGCISTSIPSLVLSSELGPTIVWIGWEFHINAGFIILPVEKRKKLLELLDKLHASSNTSRKTLEKFLGLALWATQLWPAMRTWLHY